MRKVRGIFIDLRNDEQVKWWNEVARKRVKIVAWNTIVETATNKPVGYIFRIEGLFKNQIIKENLKFLDDPITIIINMKK